MAAKSHPISITIRHQLPVHSAGGRLTLTSALETCLRGTGKIPDGDYFQASIHATTMASCRTSHGEVRTVPSWDLGFAALVRRGGGMNLRAEFRFIKALESPRMSRAAWSLGPCLANDSSICIAVTPGDTSQDRGRALGRPPSSNDCLLATAPLPIPSKVFHLLFYPLYCFLFQRSNVAEDDKPHGLGFLHPQPQQTTFSRVRGCLNWPLGTFLSPILNPCHREAAPRVARLGEI